MQERRILAWVKLQKLSCLLESFNTFQLFNRHAIIIIDHMPKISIWKQKSEFKYKNKNITNKNKNIAQICEFSIFIGQKWGKIAGNVAKISNAFSFGPT